MKKVISLLLAVVIIFAVAAAPLEASAYSAGEEIPFEVGNLSGSFSGNTNTDTRTQEQKDQDNKNTITTNTINGYIDKWIDEVAASQYWYEIGSGTPGVKVVSKKIYLPVERVDQLITEMKKYVPGYSVTWTEEYYDVIDFPDVPSGGKEEIAFNEIIESIDNIPNDPQYKEERFNNEDWIDGYWEYWWEYKDAVIGDVEEREISLLVPTYPGSIWVCENKNETAGWLQDYRFKLSEYCTGATVVYVKQYNIQETIKGAVKTESVLNWYGSTHTHLMEYDYIPEYGSTDVQTLTELRTPQLNEETKKYEVKKALNHKGNYHVTATQIIQKDYYDMLTYSTSEYLVLAETGMVIWQRHSVGGTSSNDAYFQQSYHWLRNADYYQKVGTQTFYVTVAEYDVVVDGENADKNKWKPNTPFGNIFTTVRIS